MRVREKRMGPAGAGRRGQGDGTGEKYDRRMAERAPSLHTVNLL